MPRNEMSAMSEDWVRDGADGEAETLTAEVSGERLDVFLARRLGVTRSFAQRLVREGRVS